MKIKSVAKGFTLIELLVVVLIIGVLTALALPGYRKVVEKSKVSDALSTMQAVAKSEHGWYLVRNNYTKDFANLDIDLVDKDGVKAEGDEFETNNFTFTLNDNSIRATRNNNEYSIFKDYESGLIYCLPMNHYVCDQFDGVNKNICENNIQGVWHNTSSSCYITNKERCLTEYGESYWISTDENDDTKGYCGYATPIKNAEIREGMESFGGSGEFQLPTIYDGGVCYANGNWACGGGTIYAGGKCETTASYSVGSCANMKAVYGTCEDKGGANRQCSGSTFKNGGTCIGRHNTACGGGTFESGSTCIAYHADSCKRNWGYNNQPGVMSTYQTGSTCQGEVSGGCSGLVNMKGTCIANKAGACTNNTYDGGCCKGDFCPTDDENVVLCSN